MSNFRKFVAFHEANPLVYAQLRDLAVQMRRTGRKRYGVKGLFEVLRWHRALETTGDTFKLCNTHTAFYARLLMEKEPTLAGFFQIKSAEAEMYDFSSIGVA